MWIFTTSGFVSAVKDNQNAGRVLLRFRDPAHAQRAMAVMYPKHQARRPQILVTPVADYRWKASVPQSAFTRLVLAAAADVMTYTNFKDACHRRQPDDRTPLMAVWSAMNRHQADEVHRQARRPRQVLGIRDTRTDEERAADGGAPLPPEELARLESRYAEGGLPGWDEVSTPTVDEERRTRDEAKASRTRP